MIVLNFVQVEDFVEMYSFTWSVSSLISVLWEFCFTALWHFIRRIHCHLSILLPTDIQALSRYCLSRSGQWCRGKGTSSAGLGDANCFPPRVVCPLPAVTQEIWLFYIFFNTCYCQSSHFASLVGAKRCGFHLSFSFWWGWTYFLCVWP